jgi:transposase InsO family protein
MRRRKDDPAAFMEKMRAHRCRQCRHVNVKPVRRLMHTMRLEEEYLSFYSYERPHQSLNNQSPAEVSYGGS